MIWDKGCISGMECNLFQVLVFLKPDFYTLLHLNPFPVA